jgi:hypothetical protein
MGWTFECLLDDGLVNPDVCIDAMLSHIIKILLGVFHIGSVHYVGFYIFTNRRSNVFQQAFSTTYKSLFDMYVQPLIC